MLPRKGRPEGVGASTGVGQIFNSTNSTTAMSASAPSDGTVLFSAPADTTADSAPTTTQGQRATNVRKPKQIRMAARGEAEEGAVQEAV